MRDEIQEKTVILPPFKHFIMSVGEIPSSYLETMTYYEMLVWFTNYLGKTVIPAINENGEAVTELQHLFVELQNYVNDYFDNLDVQEEINNKLDEMAESGELTDIIAQYLGLAGMITFNTVAEMKEAQNLVNGSKCRTLGYHSVNDGGSSLYKIRTVTNDDVIDESTLIKVYNNLLVAELILEDIMNVEQFGCYGDGTHDDKAKMEIALKSEHNLVLNKTYLLNSDITINKNVKIVGNNGKIKGGSLTFNKKVEIENINFEDIKYNAIIMTAGSLNIKNCNFKNIGIDENLVPNTQGAGIYSYTTDTTIDLNVENCVFENCYSHGALFTTGNHNINIVNNTFKDNFYRAIHIYGNHSNYIVKGLIQNNIISGCGSINTTDSGVGCNGIYSTCGDDVNVVNNFITNCYENGIEGRYNSIIGNTISYTNNDMTSHPSPSIEGIYLNDDCDCVVKNNILTHVKKRGISSIKTSGNNTSYFLIENNKIDVDLYDGEQIAIYITGAGGTNTQNKHILNNITLNSIILSYPLSNCTYSGDINLFFNKNSINKINIISNNNQLYNYSKKFTSLDDWTYSNCSPTIVTDATLSKSVVNYSYQQYNRLISPSFPALTKATIKLNIYCKGKFNINLNKNGSYYAQLLSVNNNTYENLTSIQSVEANITDDVKLWIEALSNDGEVNIYSIDYTIQFK